MTKITEWFAGRGRWLDRVRGVAYALVAALTFSLLWQAYGPVPTPIVGTVTVPNPQHPGTQMIYSFSGCKNTSISDTVARAITGHGSNDYNYPLPIIAGVAKAGCHTAHITAQLPSQMHPGLYVLVSNLTFKVNVLRTVTVVLTSNVFRVTGG